MTIEKSEDFKAKQAQKDALMTEEQKKLADKYIDRYKTLYSEYLDEFNKMDACEAAYRGMSSDYYDENEIENDTINLIHPNTEGQVSSMVDQNISAAVKGEGPSDQQFAHYGRILIDFAFRKNKIKRLIDRHERRREKFGWAWIKVYYDPDALNGFGLPIITCPSGKRIFVDGKIKDYMRLKEADYIIETMPKSIHWAKRKYPDKADAIFTGIDPDTLEYTANSQQDDLDSFTLLQVWTKEYNDTLRMLEITGDGLILYDSFEDDNLKDENGEQMPYYRKNEYNYFFTPTYEIEGQLHAMGDAELLMKLQGIVNDIDDQIVLNIRLLGKPKIFIDPMSEVDLDKLTNEDGEIIPCNEPNQNVLILTPTIVNEALIRRKNDVFDEAQRQTRFSDLMIGQRGTTDTATEAMIQQQQGNSAIDHKKTMLQITLEEVAEYCLDLMMEHYTEGKFFRITEDKDDFEWIDARQLNNIPMLKPATDGYIKEFKANHPDKDEPQWEIVKDNKGNDITKRVEFDIEITVGAGMPKNKAFLYQLIKELSTIVVQGQPLLTHPEVRKLLKDVLDIPLEDDQPGMQGMDAILSLLPPEIQQQVMQNLQQGGSGNVPPNANVQGMTANGNPGMGGMPVV